MKVGQPCLCMTSTSCFSSRLSSTKPAAARFALIRCVAVGPWSEFVLPPIAQTARVQLLFDDVVISERQASENAPTIQWLSPAPGALPDGPTVLSWQATDVDEDQLSYLVSYSSDAGNTWTTLAVNQVEPSYQLDHEHLAGGDACLVRVLVSDGWHTREVIGGPFESSRKAPEVAIITPIDGADATTGAIMEPIARAVAEVIEGKIRAL